MTIIKYVAGHSRPGTQSMITVSDKNGEIRLDGEPLEYYRFAIKHEVYSLLSEEKKHE